MKARGLRSMRGQFQVLGGAGRQQLLVEDGLINIGYRIVAFDVWPANMDGATNYNYNSILTMQTLGAPVEMDASDNRQIGWSFAQNPAVAIGPGTVGTGPMYQTFVDPDHVVVRDLFIQTSGTDSLYNYLVILEKFDLTDDEAIINIIKETSQSV